jgi:hypothetical protein
MAVFWVVAQYNTVEVTDVSEELAASIFMATARFPCDLLPSSIPIQMMHKIISTLIQAPTFSSAFITLPKVCCP